MGRKAFLLYNMMHSERSMIRTVFPSLASMKDKYSYVKKCPVLLPIGWIHRILELGLGLGKKTGEFYECDDKNDMIERRMKMAEKLGMFKTE